MMQVSSVISLPSPSFNRYSKSEVAEIAARVVEEFGSDECYEEFYFEGNEDFGGGRIEAAEEGEEGCGGVEVNGTVEEDEFEFAFVTRDSPISADEIFHNGQIRPVYPVFNRDLFLEHHAGNRNENGKESSVRNLDEKVAPVRLPLRKLFIEERETTVTMARASSSSSSEADELEGVPEDMYCVWRPKEAAADGQCKKSSSSGGSNSKRWKLRNLLHRSHSDGGKDTFVIFSSSNSGRKKMENEEKAKATPPAAGKPKPAEAPPLVPTYNRDGGEKRRSYLPYRQDLVGIFTKGNGLSKSLQPF